jgi:hypothetical protein
MIFVINFMEAVLADHAGFMMQAVKTSITYIANVLLISVFLISLLQIVGISLMRWKGSIFSNEINSCESLNKIL